MAICENLGDNLRRIRNDSGLSITKFSELLGIARSSLQNLLNGTGNPRCDTLEQIASVLGMDCAALISSPPLQELQLSEQQQKDLILLLERFSDSQEATHE